MWLVAEILKQLPGQLRAEVPVAAGCVFALIAYICVCWTSDGRRVFEVLLRRKGREGWTELPTPLRKIYHIPDDKGGRVKNRHVRQLFWETVRLVAVRGTIEGMMAPRHPKFGKRMKRFWCQVKTARYFTIYRKLTCIAGGWAQTEKTYNSRCILGFEPEILFLNGTVAHALFVAAAGHELAHIAQEARDQTLRREGITQGTNAEKLRKISRIIWTEIEAHSLFPLFPVTFLGLVGLVIFAMKPRMMATFLFDYHRASAFFLIAALSLYLYFRRHALFYK